MRLAAEVAQDLPLRVVYQGGKPHVIVPLLIAVSPTDFATIMSKFEHGILALETVEDA